MPKFIIERPIPGVGRMNADQLQELSAGSNTVLAGMRAREGKAGNIQWVQSYATDDLLFCVYNADSEELIREHAMLGKFPCEGVREVGAIIDPVTGES